MTIICVNKQLTTLKAKQSEKYFMQLLQVTFLIPITKGQKWCLFFKSMENCIATCIKYVMAIILEKTIELKPVPIIKWG